MTISRDPDAPAAVLDTNVALDWLVFADPSAEILADRIGTRAWRWLACDRMRGELADVLARTPFNARVSDRERALALFDRLAKLVAPVAHAPLPSSLQCSDPDDQVFVDVAIQHQARWLFTRDKALLALAPAARRQGLEIVAPARWEPDTPIGK